MMRLLLGGCLFLVGCTPCSAFCIERPQRSLPYANAPSSLLMMAETTKDDGRRASLSSSTPAADSMSNGLRAAAISASVFVATMAMPPVPASLAAPTLNEAIVEVSETSYPILRALDATNFQDFSSKIGDILLKTSPDKLAKSIELGIDVLDSAQPEKLEELNAVLKETYADLKIDSCTLVPLPPMTIVNKFESIAEEKVNADKLKTFKETWKPSLDALAKTDNAICLPPTAASLDKLALAQADLARTFGKAESKAFASFAGPVVKSSFPVSKALSLVNDAKKLVPTATPIEKKQFADAGKKVELASRLEMSRIERAELIEKQAAKKAALTK